MKKNRFFSLLIILSTVLCSCSSLELDTDKLMNAFSSTEEDISTDYDSGIISNYASLPKTPNENTEQEFAANDFQDGVYRYYYDHLSEEDKIIYSQIYNILYNVETDVELYTLDVDKANELGNYVLLDNPSIFYIDTCKYTTISNNSGEMIQLTYSAVPLMDESSIISAREEIEAYTQELVSAIGISPSEATESQHYDIAVGIYTYLIGNTDYVEDSLYNQSMYSLILGQTVCQGYATAFKYFCDLYQIPCILVSGTANGTPHAWNLVFLDRNWCHVDCTYGDGAYINTDISYTWFGFSDETASLSRTMANTDLLPECTSFENDYYYRSGILYDTYDLEQIVELSNASENHCFSFKFTNGESYAQACENLFSDSSLSELMLNGGSINYINDDDSYTLYIVLYPN